MADNGKLYTGFNAEFVENMKSLVFSADMILPNITEACLLTDTEYREKYEESYIDGLVERLLNYGAKTIILTGVSYDDETTGVLVVENGTKKYYRHRKISRGSHGTGDIYASAFVGAYLNGDDVFKAAKIAADYTVLCIENTVDDDSHRYGVKFEPMLKEYIKML